MANGRILISKPSGGVTTVTSVDGAGNTNLVLPESGSVATTAGATETSTGLVELATTAETQAGTDDLRAITPLKLFNSLKGSNQSLSVNGYQKLHGGLIIQWGVNAVAGNSSLNVTLPMTFPNAGFMVVCSFNEDLGASDTFPPSAILTSTSVVRLGNGTGAMYRVSWITIGY